MKRLFAFPLVLAMILSLCAFPGCTDTMHKPTTAANAGTSALVAYSVAGAGVGQYLALPLCATPPVYPCKTQAINDKLAAADTVAYNAAVAADNAVNDVAAQAKAKAAADALKAESTKATAASKGGN